jgi:hypothetical protein
MINKDEENKSPNDNIYIKFNYPFVAFVEGVSPENLKFSAKFKENIFFVEIFLESETPIEIKEGEFKGTYFCRTKNLFFQLRSKKLFKEYNNIDSSILENQSFQEDIYIILVPIINRVLRNLRIFAIIPYIREERLNRSDLKLLLRQWNVEIKINGKEWQPLYKKELPGSYGEMIIKGLGAFYHNTKIIQFKSHFFRDVIEAI